MIRLLPASRHSLVASRARRRRGTAYIFVLSLCILIAVVAVTLLSGSQIRARIIVANNDVTEASVLAESAVERVLTLLVSDPNWRTTYSNGIETTPITLGRGTISLKLVDEADGSLANDPTQPVRAYGIGRVGSTTRIYSVQLRPYDAPLDVLKTACHAGGNASTSSVISAAGGPFSANGTLTINSAATVNGNVEAPVVSNLGGTVNGAVKVVPVKQLPSATVFDSYKAQATEILFSGISGGTITLNVLSPAVNPYGATNSKGIYYIHVPSTGTLTINQARLVATLLVDIDSGGKFTTSNAWVMEPPSASQPTLIIRAAGGSTTINLNGASTSLSEVSTSVNFNPPGTPFPWIGGTSDSDKLDTYAAAFSGIANVVGAAQTVNLGSNFATKGTVIIEGTAALGGNINLQVDPLIAENPPTGYTASQQMVPVTGTWRWEILP